MEDVIGTSQIMTKIVMAIGAERGKLFELGRAKAETEAMYKKFVAITMVKLLRGDTLGLDNVEVKCTSQTNLKSFAEGLCHKELAAKLVAENEYKSCIVNLECLRANLNANQSIFRHLDIGGETG